MQTGQKIAGYELISRLGHGAMGEVFMARQLSMDRFVALKILPKELAIQPGFADRFMQEVRVTARLNHPHIVTGIDAGQERNVFYYAMEYVEGQSLRREIEQAGRLTEARTLEIGVAIASALAHAHDNGILHRDVKPENILIDRDGKPKLCDLGLAKIQKDSEAYKHLTLTGMSVGTPHYISPEQAAGERELDGRTDLYSLGVTLYHAITGRTPFDAPTAASVMVAHINNRMSAPAEYGVKISRGFTAVLAKLMTKRREDRYANAQLLYEDLLCLQQGESPQHALLLPARSPFKPGQAAVNRPVTALSTRPSVHQGTRPAAQSPLALMLAVSLAVIVIGLSVLLLSADGRKARAVDGDSSNTKPKMPETRTEKQQQLQVPLEQSPTSDSALQALAPLSAVPVVEAESVEHEKSESKKTVEPAQPAPEVTQSKPQESVEILPAVEEQPVRKPTDEASLLSDDQRELLQNHVRLCLEGKFESAAERMHAVLNDKKLELPVRKALGLRADQLKFLSQSRQQLIDLLNRPSAEPRLLIKVVPETDRRLGSRSDRIVSADARFIGIKSSGGMLSLPWSSLSVLELYALIELVQQPLNPDQARALALLAFDADQIELARQLLQPIAEDAHREYLLDQIEQRELVLSEVRRKTREGLALKLMDEMETLLSAPQLELAELRKKLAQFKTECADCALTEQQAELLSRIEQLLQASQGQASKLPQGNLALAKHGVKVLNALRPAEMIDGNATRYDGASGYSHGKWPCQWIVEFPVPILLRELRILLWDGNDRYYRYTVDYSADGKSFRQLADRSKGRWRSWQTIQTPPVLVKHLRINGIFNSANAYFHIVELEAYSVPPDKPALPKYPSTAD